MGLNFEQSEIDKHIDCMLDGSRGIYLPQAFAENYTVGEWLSNQEQAAELEQILLAGPDHEFYDDAWDELRRDAVHTDKNGLRWYLYQDGDLFMVSEKFNVEEWAVEESDFAEDDEEETEER